jgi:hypothetical protein
MNVNDNVLQMVLSPDSNQLSFWGSSSFHIINLESLETLIYLNLALNRNYSHSGGQIMLSENLYITGTRVDISTDDTYVTQSLVDGGVQIILPDTSIERFIQIATFCNAPASLTEIDTTMNVDVLSQMLLDELNMLPENTLSSSCMTDLRLMAVALTHQQEIPISTPTPTP